MTEQEQKAFDQMREALEKIAQSTFNARSIAEHAVAIANVATANQERTESILIDGNEYTVPAPVAAEILRLHLENRGAIQERDAIYDLMDNKRKCMEELRDALVYHMEQTRPIQRSIDALAAANAVSHEKPETTPAPEGVAITSESAANAVSHPQATEPAEKRKLYECTGCGHIYMDKVAQCDCLENPANTYNDWIATPAAPEAP